VALDCEMVGVVGGQREVVLICAVDYLTGAPILRSLVQPTRAVVDWSTRISGVTPEAVAAAVARGAALDGWRAARAALWARIDADTVLVGHALQHDLDVLRMVHTRVVDSAILAQRAVGGSVGSGGSGGGGGVGGGRQWGLQALCAQLLGVAVQNHGAGGGGRHECMEDALAAREVVLWCCRNPLRLAAWGRARREEAQRQLAEQKEKQQKLREQREKEKDGPKPLGPDA
jgi:DNA polymerase III epsilon subunit-like protein